MTRSGRRLITVLGGGGAAPTLTFTATTTGAETVTLAQIAPTQDVTVDWGDGSASETIANGNLNPVTHNYASAGTWTIKVSDPDALSGITLTDAKLSLDTKWLRHCGPALTTLYLSGLHAGCRIHSADMAHLNVTHDLYLSFVNNGDYSIDSADFSAYTNNYRFAFQFTRAGDYKFDTADIAGISVSLWMYLEFSNLAVGTYTVNTAHFATCNCSIFGLLFGSSVTSTVARADFAGFTKLDNVFLQFGMSQAQVDAVLLGMYDAFAARTATGGDIRLNGLGNAAPSGTLQAACPPTTGNEARYELVFDTCGVSSNHWTSIAANA